jgi:hypothetical protein
MLEKYCVLPSNRQTLYTSMVISAPASWASEFAMLSNDLLIHQALIYWAPTLSPAVPLLSWSLHPLEITGGAVPCALAPERPGEIPALRQAGCVSPTGHFPGYGHPLLRSQTGLLQPMCPTSNSQVFWADCVRSEIEARMSNRLAGLSCRVWLSSDKWIRNKLSQWNSTLKSAVHLGETESWQ